MIKSEYLALLPQTREEQRTGTFQYFTVKGSRIVLNARENDLYQIFVQNGETGPTEEHQAMWSKIVTGFQSSPIDQVKPFRYEALPTLSSIRLVQVTQSAEDGMIHLATRTYDLNESMPQYDCLSYTWGNPHARLSMIDFHAQNEKKYDPSILWPVICDGKLLYVRRNLYDALRHMPEKRFSDMVAATSEDQLNDYKAQVVLLQKILFDKNSPEVKARMSTISIAASKGYMEFCRQAMRMGFDPHEKDSQGLTAIDYAMKHGHSIIARLMVDEYDNSQTATANTRLIWIDAVCINQEDLAERSSQVQMMGEIYSKADRVNVWLGVADFLSEHAIKAITKLTPAIMDGRLLTSKIVPFAPSNLDQSKAYANAGIPELSALEWAGLAAIYLRQYFRRIWTLQEAVLANNVFTFLGEKEIAWDLLLFLAHEFKRMDRMSGKSFSTRFQPDYGVPVETEAEFIWECRMRRTLDHATEARRQQWFKDSGGAFSRGKGKPYQLSLLEFVKRAGTLKCFDPRDRIYGVIGMAGDDPDMPQIVVDYTKPAAQLWSEVTRHHIYSSKVSDPSVLGELLGHMRDTTQTELKDLPSWVPDYGYIGCASLSTPSFQADGGARHTESVSDKWNQLTVRGVKIGNIDRVARPRSRSRRVTQLDLDPSWFELVLHMPPTNGRGQSRTEVLWRTLCADQQAQGHNHKGVFPAPSEYSKQFKDLVCAMILRARDRKAKEDGNPAVIDPLTIHLLSAMLAISSDTEGQSSPSNITADSMVDFVLLTSAIADADAGKAISLLKALEDDETCDTPTIKEIADYIRNPTYRLPEDPGAPLNEMSFQGLDRKEGGFMERFRTIYGYRRLYITEDHSLGLGPGSLETGDEVWVLAGMNVPVVLKRQNSSDDPQKYRFLGETYVHDYMHGEAIAQPDREFESIVLE